MESPHFVLVPLPAQGHLIPMLDFARLLLERGVRVTIVSTPVNRARIQKAMAIASGSSDALSFADLPFPAREFGLPDGCEHVGSLADDTQFLPFFHAMDTLEEPLELFLRSQRPLPSCVVHDACNPWAAGAVRRAGVPRLAFQASPCFFHLANECAMRHGLFDGVDEFEPLVVPDMPVRLEVSKATGAGCLNGPEWDGIRARVVDTARTADGVVLNTFQDLERQFVECYEKLLGKRVWTLGPFCLCHKDDAKAMAALGRASGVDERQVLSWLDSKKPKSVIYVNFGSLTHKQPRELREIACGLEAAGAPFVWVLKEAEADAPEVEEWLKDFEARNTGKGLVVRGWAPQLAILAHQAVGGFMTHCGWNSILESVAMGVPMVTWPHFADQFVNERLVVDVLGVGVLVGAKAPVGILSKGESMVKSEDVEKAVSVLMDGGEEGEERRKVRELGEKAHKAMGTGGSSYVNLTQLIESFMQSEARMFDHN